MLIENVIENLKKITRVEANDLCNAIVGAFEDLELKEGEEVIVSSPESAVKNFNASPGMHYAYVRQSAMSAVLFEVVLDNGLYSIADAW